MASYKVILLADNAKCYSSSNLNLCNTTIYYFPPNTTSRLQLLDTGILLVQNNEDEDKDPINNDDVDKLMEEIKADIELFNFRNAIDFEKKDTSKVLNSQEIVTLVTNVESTENLGKDDNSEKDEDDSKEIPMITHHEVLNTVEVLEQYLMQQDLSETAWFDHNQALLNLQKAIRKI
ncbi:26717_t:CDS:2 [Gigaspora margarita]|uniref:26717_t:CDS:1 n=1 Tax=Gigaspora margarita TaxID=4874 RepID=A0ABN7WH19_GIGMA|nr:26717_t:CDS:2 [Gigaspora margarita]